MATTMKELEGLVNRLNILTGSQQKPWNTINGKNVAIHKTETFKPVWHKGEL